MLGLYSSSAIIREQEEGDIHQLLHKRATPGLACRQEEREKSKGKEKRSNLAMSPCVTPWNNSLRTLNNNNVCVETTDVRPSVEKRSALGPLFLLSNRSSVC